MLKIIAVLGLSLSLSSCLEPAIAHDKWANGDPIPDWVKSSCCGISDAHHLRAEQVHVVAGGYKVDGYNDIIPEETMTPSPDGEYWVFYADLPQGKQSKVYCFFGPLRGV